MLVSKVLLTLLYWVISSTETLETLIDVPQNLGQKENKTPSG